MARLPEFLNISAAGRVRLALPTARLAIIAFSFTLATVGMGAFVTTLPSASAVGTRSSLPASPPAVAAAWARSLVTNAYGEKLALKELLPQGGPAAGRDPSVADARRDAAAAHLTKGPALANLGA